MRHNWVAGLKTFLWSPTGQFYYSSMLNEDQKAIPHRIARYIEDIEDEKTYKTFFPIIEDTLTKKPYVKNITLVLFENPKPAYQKTARECLKNLTSEDFMQLYQLEQATMNELEKRLRNTQGHDTEHELAKIVNRYQTEGKPEFHYSSSESRKQVRFEEQSAFAGGQGHQISQAPDNQI